MAGAAGTFFPMKRKILTRAGFFLLCICTFFLYPSGNLRAAELVMLEKQGCMWCQRWHAEIGGIYPKTEESLIAPLRIVDVNDPWPDDLKTISSDIFTPTFILVEKGVEVSRIRGYGGDEFFWYLLADMLKKLPPEQN